MISKEDFLSYFGEMELMEKTMRDIYGATLSKINDPEILTELNKLMMEEEKHANLVEEIKILVINNMMRAEK